MQTNNYLALDAIARRIWESLENPITVGDLCTQLSREFRAEPGKIESDVLAFLDELQSEKLLNVIPG